MATNQLMTIKILGDEIQIWHKDFFASLTDLWRIVNHRRDSYANLSMFLQLKATTEYIEAAKSEWGIDEIVRVEGKGNKRKTYAHISLMIYAAQYLSPAFHAPVIRTFVQNRILHWRDDSGDEFKALNLAIDQHLPGREGKTSNHGIYITCAKMLREKIQPDGDDWNTATAHQLQQRHRIENQIVTFLNMGFIRDFDHLKEVIDKL